MSRSITDQHGSDWGRGHVAAVHNLSWLRQEDLRTLRDKLHSGEEFAPLPRSPKLQRIAWLDLARLLGSHNAWVRLWNVHETDRSLPLSPDWWDGSTAAGVRPRRLFINEQATGRTILVKMNRTWETFHPGWSFCRNEAPLVQVEWAGVQQYRGTMAR